MLSGNILSYYKTGILHTDYQITYRSSSSDWLFRFILEAGPSQRKQQPYVIFIGSVVAVIVISCFTVFIYYLRRRRVSEMQGN